MLNASELLIDRFFKTIAVATTALSSSCLQCSLTPEASVTSKKKPYCFKPELKPADGCRHLQITPIKSIPPGFPPTLYLAAMEKNLGGMA